MNTAKMYDAMSKIDDDLIEHSLEKKNNGKQNDEQNQPASNRGPGFRRWILIPICIVLLVACSLLIIIPNLSKGPVADPIQSEDPSSKPNVSEGAHTDSQDISTAQESFDSNEPDESGSEQPVPEVPEFGETISVVPVEDGGEPLDGYFECWVETSSFVRKGSTITIAAHMGDKYTLRERLQGEPRFSSFEVSGYPVFFAADHPEEDYNVPVDGAKWFSWTLDQDRESGTGMVINGSEGYFEKWFSKDEMTLLDLGDFYDQKELSDYHLETVEVRFDQLEEGDWGLLDIGFGWMFYDARTNGWSYKTPLMAAMRHQLYYYVGDVGIGLSFISIEEAKSNMETSKTINKEPMSWGESFLCCPEDPVYLLRPSLQESYPHGSVITLQFSIVNTESDRPLLVSVSGSEGVNILSKHSFVATDYDNPFEIRFFLDDELDVGEIIVTAENDFSCDLRSNSHCFEEKVFCLHNGSKDYLSHNSIDDLAKWSEALTMQLLGINRSGESVNRITENGNRYIPSYTVQGYVFWTDSAGNTHPARNAVVEIRGVNSLYPNTSWLLDETTTDDSGYYSKTMICSGSGENILARIFSKGLNITVMNSSGDEYYYDSSAVSNVGDGDVITISYTAITGTDLGLSLGVHQAFELGNRYMYSLEGDYLDNIDIAFPDTSHSSCCYSSSNNKIYITAARKYAWDVMLHEYGHYVQHCFGISNSPGLSHSPSANLADSYNDKSKGIRVAWGEGWATYFSINAQRKMNASSMNIPYVGDKRYNNCSTIDFSIETIESQYRLGEANEVAVAATLYDMTDGTSTSDHDLINCSNSTIWSITKNSHCKTLSDFVTAFYGSSSYSTQTKLKLGSTLSYHYVAANLDDSPTGLETNTPTFFWDKQGRSATFPNDSFRLAFYDSSFTFILRTSACNATSQTLTSTQWNQVKSSGNTVYCCVETYQTSSPSTGVYNSNFITLNLN